MSDSLQSTEESQDLDSSISNEVPGATGGAPSLSKESAATSSEESISLALGNSTEDSATTSSKESAENNSAESTESSEMSSSQESNESKCVPGTDQECDSDSDESDMMGIGDNGEPEPFDGFFMPFDTPGELLLRR